MQTSIVIVSKDRKQELERTLAILAGIVNFTTAEILVFLDGCSDGSEDLIPKFKNVRWYQSPKSIGASSARKELYTHAKGEILIGFDDDAHPLHHDFVEKAKELFDNNPTTAIIAFEEVRGIYASDKEALEYSKQGDVQHFCGEFIGCGFAIRKDCYDATNGFPEWIDIYGEEACVAIQVLNNGCEILYTNAIKVNHRVNKTDRIQKGKNYFKFGKQLKNETFFYCVYYPNPMKKIARLYWHNLKTYAVKDLKYFQIYISTIFRVLFKLPKVLNYRNPVHRETIKKREALH